MSTRTHLLSVGARTEARPVPALLSAVRSASSSLHDGATYVQVIGEGWMVEAVGDRRVPVVTVSLPGWDDLEAALALEGVRKALVARWGATVSSRSAGSESVAFSRWGGA